MISGKPVSSETWRTGIPASESSRAVPPVEIISIPRSARPRANSTIPVLSDTDSRARATCTSPGETVAWRATSSVPCCMYPPTLPLDDDAARVGRVKAHRILRDQPHRLGQQLVLDRVQLAQHVGRLAGRRQLDRPLENHRSGVDAPVDEV